MKIADLTVQELKDRLRSKGLPVSGTKAVLIERLKSKRARNASTKRQNAKRSKQTKRAKAGPETVDTTASEFRFYSSMYYQSGKASLLALRHLEEHGLPRSLIDSFDDHIELSVYIREYQKAI